VGGEPSRRGEKHLQVSKIITDHDGDGSKKLDRFQKSNGLAL